MKNLGRTATLKGTFPVLRALRVAGSAILLSSTVAASPALVSFDFIDDVPVAPFESALHPLGLYRPFNESSWGRCVPRHVHLSLGDEPARKQLDLERYHDDYSRENGKAAMTVSFSIPRGDAACKPEAVRVWVAFGANNDGGAMKRRQRARPEDVLWYNATSDRTGAYYESDWIYHVQLKGLRHDAEYRYRIDVEEGFARENDGGFEHLTLEGATSAATAVASIRRRAAKDRGNLFASSSDLTFRTSPPLGSAAPAKVAILADLGQTYNSTQTMLNVLHETMIDPSSGDIPASLAVLAGDLSYADSDQTRWDNWLALVEPLISRTALQVSAGNHEIECDAVTRDIFVAYEHRFRMPNSVGRPAVTRPIPEAQIDPIRGCGSPSVFRGTYDGGNAYYAFTYGMMRFVALSPYSDTTLGSRQHRWLKRELKSVDRSITPWVVVYTHTQFYTTFLGHNDEKETTLMRQAVEPLFVRYGVNLVVCGHDHAYMRSHPMQYGASDPTGKSPIYIIVGEGGNREHHAKGYIRPEPEEWVVQRDRTEYGFATLEVQNATRARWRWVRDGTGNGGVTDDVWLPNQYFL